MQNVILIQSITLKREKLKDITRKVGKYKY